MGKISGVFWVVAVLITFQVLWPRQLKAQEKDVTDILRKILHKEKDTTKAKKVTQIAILPSLAYNPSFGFLAGGKATAGRWLGNPSNTAFSAFGLEAMITTKGILSVQARHNLFTNGNAFNFQGNWQLAKYAVVDYGIGTGQPKKKASGFILNDYPTANSDSAFPIRYNFVRLSEKVYRKIGPHLFMGAGISINTYSAIDDKKLSDTQVTPHYSYSTAYGFDPKKYAANGLSLALQFNTREHPFRSFGGMYADMNVLFNQQWLGSSGNSVQLQVDIRKYWSLSKKHPDHVLAIWHLATYQLDGTIPYLQLPGTATDTYNRSGRAYTIGYFKGPSYVYFETEYRFPILTNGLVSGVLFLHEQSASDARNNQLFNAWELGGGAGLRILFQKESRTTMCIDYGMGRYGSSGLFFGLNEAF